ncbi:MAG: LacI family DNA-binding transcriptional regulator [Kineosporiaceae bacterium]
MTTPGRVRAVGMGRVTLQTIADRVGVSRMTVSNAFSRPDQLSEDLRTRILAAAADLGYVGPDPAARALARGTSGAVGVLLSDSVPSAFTNEVATSFLGAVAEELAPTGLALTLLTAGSAGDLVPARDVAMDGALVYSCDTESPAAEILSRRGLPLVFVDQEPAPGVPTVNVDDRAGARAAAQHLVDLGHRRVGVLTAGIRGQHGVLAAASVAGQHHTERQRILGWMDALGPAGVDVRVVRAGHGTPQDGADAAPLLLDVARPPTAVLCFSDALAAGFVRAATDSGRRVPEDVSVVGFDDNPIAARMRPALTTVRQDHRAKGHAAAAALTEAMRRARAGQGVVGRHVLLPTELVVRESTAAPHG